MVAAENSARASADLANPLKRIAIRSWHRGMSAVADIGPAAWFGAGAWSPGSSLPIRLINPGAGCRKREGRIARHQRHDMKAAKIVPLLLVLLFLQAIRAFALSTPIGRDINFPKDYDPQRAKAIRSAIQDERFKFVGGIVSYWPPEFGTRLSFEGDADSLNDFLAALRRLPGIGLRLVLYHGRSDELRRDSPWQLDFSQARPDQLTVYINLNGAGLDLDKVKLPEWPLHSRPPISEPQSATEPPGPTSPPAPLPSASSPNSGTPLGCSGGVFAPVLLRHMQEPLRDNEVWVVQTVLLNPAEGNLADPGGWAAPAKLLAGNAHWK